jgi:MFS family permease
VNQRAAQGAHSTSTAALLIFIGLQLGQVMSTLDGTIVATALPTITEDLGDFERVTWVITAYTLAVVASMPLYGKLGDLYGRKRILIAAISIFLVASAACGAAQSMADFIASTAGGSRLTSALQERDEKFGDYRAAHP